MTTDPPAFKNQIDVSDDNTVNTCGLVIGAFKPYTKGHHFLIKTASHENELVLVYVSYKDRERKGELKIFADKMKIIWETFLFFIMPKNVFVSSAWNPIVSLYGFLKNMENDQNCYTIFTIYMDDKDRKRYCLEDLQLKEKYPRLMENNLIRIRTFNRKNNVDISATKMRKYIQQNNYKDFVTGLPEELQGNNETCKKIFEILSA